MENDLIKMKGIFKNGYGLISKIVMQDNELSIQAKGLYAYICSFTGKGSGAFPTRKKICFDLDISNDSLSRYINELTEKQYIAITKNKDESGRFTNNIYNIIFTLPCPKFSDTDISDTEIFVYDKSDTNNNNNNNNKYNNNSESLLELLEKNFCRTFNAIEIEEIMSWEDNDLTRYAIKKAVLNNKCNINYISKILYNYKKENVRSVSDAIQKEEEFQSKKTTKKVQTAPKQEQATPKKEAPVIPEWFDTEIEAEDEENEEGEQLLADILSMCKGVRQID